MLERPLILFTVSYVFGLVTAITWLAFGEAWQIFGDAVHYVSLYEGEIAPAPWGYRIMTPYLASLLPWDMVTNFSVVSINSMALITGVLALYGRKVGCSFSCLLIMIFFWMTSYAFAYYSTAIVRADPPMLLMLATLFLLSQYRVHSIVLLLLISIGTLFHEMVLVLIPALWLDKVFSGKITGGANYQYQELFLISVFSLLFLVVSRFFLIDISTAVELKGFNPSILEYTGGLLKHALRMYAAYGPVLLFCLFFVFSQRIRSIVGPFVGLLFIVSAATFYATDTLRVMALLYIFVFFYGSKWISIHLKNKEYNFVIAFIVLQFVYSLVVYAHLRSFETSMFLNAIAAIASLASLILCISIFNKKLRI